MTDRVYRVRRAIEDVIDGKGTQLVSEYYNEQGPFAGRLFDELPNNNPVEFTPEDLVAASLLDIRFNAPAVRALVVEPHALNELLGGLGEERPLWETHDLSAANQLWKKLREVPIGRTRASKLLARKRP